MATTKTTMIEQFYYTHLIVLYFVFFCKKS